MFRSLITLSILFAPLPLFSYHGTVGKINQKRLLLTKLRKGGNYAHAGDEEAIDIVVQNALEFNPHIKNSPTLDVGSGFGGTADYLHKLGFKKVEGIDLDSGAVSYATTHYPHIPFIHGDAKKMATLFPASSFSFLTLFNVLYGIEDKKAVLENLSAVAKPGALLVLFDYTQQDHRLDFKDLAGRKMHPIEPKGLEKILSQSGWELISTQDIRGKTIEWYEHLLDQLKLQEAELIHTFSREDIESVKMTFVTLLEKLQKNEMGSCIFYARKVA